MQKAMGLAMLMVLGGMVAVAQAETVLYQDSFSHSSTYFPNSAVETVAADAASYGATSTTWTTSGSWRINTTSGRAYVSSSGNVWADAWLALTPQTGYVYTLTASVMLEGYESGDYLALGFAYGSTGTPATNAAFYNVSKAWIVQNNTADYNYSTGYGTYNIGTAMRTTSSWTSSYVSYSQTSIKGFCSFKVVLDTRTFGAWVASFYVNDTLIRSETYAPVYDSEDKLTNPTITAVGFGGYLSYGSVDSFKLTADVPEPSTLAILAAGLVGLAAYAWRKRK